MNLNVFAIYDNAAAAYMTPFYLPSAGLAVRAFTDMANDPKSMVGRHPSDYCLYEMGIFNDSTGKHSQEKPPTEIIRAIALVKEPDPTLPIFDEAEKAEIARLRGTFGKMGQDNGAADKTEDGGV